MTTLRTIICHGDDQETVADVTYTYRKGDPGSYYQPPEPASVEIDAIVVVSGDALPDDHDADDDLIAECMADYLDRAEYAADQAYEARREALRDGW